MRHLGRGEITGRGRRATRVGERARVRKERKRERERGLVSGKSGGEKLRRLNNKGDSRNDAPLFPIRLFKRCDSIARSNKLSRVFYNLEFTFVRTLYVFALSYISGRKIVGSSLFWIDLNCSIEYNLEIRE